MPNEQLTGWKEIAGFLKTSERTAHRWERLYRMPVHRVPGAHGAAVFATVEELEQWRRTQDLTQGLGAVDGASRETRRRIAWLPLAGALLLALVAVLAISLAFRASWSSAQSASERGPKSPAVAADGVRPAELLSLELRVVPGTTAVRATTPSGGLVKVAVDGGSAFGLMAARRGEVVDAVVVSLPEGPGEARQIGTLHLRRDANVSFANGGIRFEVTWREAVARASKNAGADDLDPSKSCSIACDRLTVTAAAVETQCGRCCEPGVCPDTHRSR
jgi:hypothetical protein